MQSCGHRADFKIHMKITDRLFVEHQLLRVMLAAMGRWLEAGMPADVLRARAVLLGSCLRITHNARGNTSLTRCAR
jgi:hypothetical protein